MGFRDLSPPLSYAAAVTSAASAVTQANLPPSALIACASEWAALGSVAAALLIPKLPVTLGIALALSTRPTVCALTTLRRGGGALATASFPTTTLPRFATLDACVACSYLLNLLREVSDEVLWGLGASRGLGGDYCTSSVNSLGVWPSVATLLALACTGEKQQRLYPPPNDKSVELFPFPTESPEAITDTLRHFSARLAGIGLGREALLVAAAASGGGVRP